MNIIPSKVREDLSDMVMPPAGGWSAQCRNPLARNVFNAGALYAARDGGSGAAPQEPGPGDRDDARRRARLG